MEGDFPKAKKIIDKELKKDSDNFDLLELNGQILMRDKPKEALFFLNKALNRYNEMYGVDFAIKKMDEIRNEEESQDWFFKNKQIIHSYEDLMTNLTIVLIRLNKLNEAKKYFHKQALLMGSENPKELDSSFNEMVKDLKKK